MNLLRPSHVLRQVRLSLSLLVLSAAFLTGLPSAAWAQLSRVGNSQGVLVLSGGSLVLGADVAYDPAHSVYLVVGAGGAMGGVFTDVTGAVVPGTSSFQIGPAMGGANSVYGAHPRAFYSAELNNGQGGFLVTWIQNTGGPSFVHSTVVSYPAGVVGGDQTVSDTRNFGALYEAAAAIGYSTTSHKFLVAWQTGDGGHIQGRFLDQNGTVSGGIMEFEPGCSRDPGVTWNSATDEFGVSSSGYCNGAYAGLRRVAASSGTQSNLTTFGYSAGTFVSDVTVNPSTHHYLVGWASSAGGNIAELDEAGNFIRANAAGTGTYDGFHVSFNTTSGTLLAVGMGNSAEVLGVEADGTGVPTMTAMALTNGGGTSGSYYPRAVARTGVKQWNLAYSRQLTTGTNQILATGSSGGGGGGGGGVSNIQMAIESPSNGQLVSGSTPFTLSGFAADLGAPSGTGISSIHVWSFPSGSSTGTFLTAITSFTTSNSASGLLGPQFANAGFSIPIGGLSPGTYTLVLVPRSTVLNNFGPPKTVTVTVGGTLPLMGLEAPANGAATGNTFNVGGWALDKFASSGSGVDAVHVWATPTAGGASIFLGAATLGIPRSDVGAVFGGQFGGAGFSLPGVTLSSGGYVITAFARVTATGSFAISQSVTITVGAVSNPTMNVENPTSGMYVSTNAFTIGGWAIDRGAGGGTGVNAVHVWAFPTNGNPAFFVGAANYGGSRSDVQAAYGANFLNSGFVLNVPSGLVPPGLYNIAVYARSTIAGQFNQVRVIQVNVQ